MIFVLPLIMAVSLLVYYHLRSKNRQKEILIEKGINPDGISILAYQKIANLTNSVLFLFIALCCGIGFMIHYFIFRNAQIK